MSSPIVFPTRNQSSIPILTASGHLRFSLSSHLGPDNLRSVAQWSSGNYHYRGPVSGQGHLNCVIYHGFATVHG